MKEDIENVDKEIICPDEGFESLLNFRKRITMI